MKKNLKKALSAVIALAVAVSMIPASFAAKLTLTDVADTASYATAVNTLVALDIINGYEDNSFKPDNLITRAETTKVVVAALNKISAAEGMKGSTGFKDVEARHEWATGFINAGVAEGFINGMENNTFGPDLNVTYAQIVTMLVRALGYEEYAKYMGGYPNGYLSIAGSEGVTKGVSASANTPVTRAQVAVLVYNALQTPIVANTGMEYNASTGGFVPSIQKMDGTGDADYYKTLLTEDFDAYFVEGYVAEVNKSDAEIKFVVAKSEKYDNDEVSLDKTYTTLETATEKGQQVLTNVKVGDTDAVNYNGSYAQAIIRFEDDGDVVLVSFIPSNKNKVETVAASLIDTANLTDDDDDGEYSIPADVNYLEYFASESASKSTKYKLQTVKDDDDKVNLKVKLYVNGVEFEGTKANIAKYVVNNNVGDVQLVDTYKTDDYYDTIYVNYYATAKIGNVIPASGKITLEDILGATGNSIVLDDEDETLVYHIYYNGEEISISDLKVGDVISIAYDVKGALSKSKFYDIYVSRDVVSAKLTSINDTDRVLKFADTTYDLVANYEKVVKENKEYTIGNEYDLYIDAFGRIFGKEDAKTADNYAIVDRYTRSSSDDDYKAVIYTAEGAQKTYVVDSAKASVTVGGKTYKKGDKYKDGDKEKEYTEVNVQDAIGERLYNSWDGTPYKEGNGKKAVQNRVVKYKVSSSTGYITSLEFINAKDNKEFAGEFNGRTSQLAGIKMDSSTKVIDAITYAKGDQFKIADLAMSSVDKFVDSKTYGMYVFGDKNSSGIYPLVVVTAGAYAFDENTRFAVVAGGIEQGQNDGDTIYTVPVFYKGAANDEVQKIDVNDDAEGDAAKDLKYGDIIVFSTNAKGYVDKLYKISKWTNEQLVNYGTMFTESVKDYTQFVALPAAADTDSWSDDWDDIKEDEVTLVYGVIVDRTSKNLSLGKIAGKETNDVDDVIDISMTSDTNVYQYDYSQGKDRRLSVINPGAIQFTKFNKTYYKDGIIDWASHKVGEEEQNTNREIANFAYVLVADGEALDVFVLTADTSK